MELVYLWVEEYKNIKNQGFNFSPRFECEFKAKYYSKGNSNGGLKKRIRQKISLSITSKMSEFLFPTNVNITTIVGKNGTGKSRLLKLLYGFYTNQLENNVNCFAIFYDYEQEKHFYLGDKEKFYCLQEYNELKDTAFALFDYSLTYQPEFNYEQDKFIYPKKQINSIKGAISLTKELIRNQKNILLNYFELKKHNQLDKFKDFFIADKIVIEFHNARFQNTIDNKKGLLNDKKQEVIKIISSISVGQTLADFIEKLKEVQNILNKQDSFEKKEEPDFKNLFFLDWFQWCEQIKKDNQEKNFWDKDFVNNKIWNEFIKDKTVTPQKSFKEIVEMGESNVPSYEILSDEVKNLNKDLIDIILASFGQEYFTIKLIDKNQKVLNELSFGEQQLIFILNQLFALRYEKFKDIEEVEAQEIDVEKDINNFIVLLDEIDIGFHPDWQKRAIQYVCDFLKLIPEKKFHLVFTTHSPFLLSDLPKENVIFLQKDEDRNCKNVSKETSIETFGANIHTLLSNGFFMNDGLMGEFAKNKINQVYNFIIQKDTNFIKTKKEAQNIINLIGEPLIKKQLQKLFDETFDKSNLTLDDEIELLEKKLNALKELKNDKN
ncbi:AAA family ATPase [Aliarcobacter butzleri]|uniref:AAA family ATPase n=1 Tax=Aliarcobacter butzleri TaxID=28197 RepID=A0AAW6VPZ2_9BACT|nr:AAA family ATPase [Aliarcobacter butzleri]MDK2062068.1 AAA family ATPase [Aliarcobacter butzleri]MDK2071031.1 AAA family ATPase [Aliarcobacter butzleri]